MVVGNWARWGDDSVRGALNLIGPDAVRRGMAAVRTGRPLALGLPISPGEAPRNPIRPEVQHLMLRDGGDYAAGLAERPGYGYADDVLILACHGTSHLDALGHVWQEGTMWNGVPCSEVSSRGARWAGIETTGPIATRGLLVDFGDREPGRGAITAHELEGQLDRARLEPQPGDALLIRTGWLARWRAGTADLETWPGVDASIADLVDRYDLAVIGADTISAEVNPSNDPACALPVHIALIRDRGVFLLELLDLEELAESAATSFLLVVSPLRIRGGTGSPVSPTAII